MLQSRRSSKFSGQPQFNKFPPPQRPGRSRRSVRSLIPLGLSCLVRLSAESSSLLRPTLNPTFVAPAVLLTLLRLPSFSITITGGLLFLTIARKHTSTSNSTSSRFYVLSNNVSNSIPPAMSSRKKVLLKVRVGRQIGPSGQQQLTMTPNGRLSSWATAVSERPV